MVDQIKTYLIQKKCLEHFLLNYYYFVRVDCCAISILCLH